MARFKVGDILDIYSYHQCDEEYQQGIIMVIEYVAHYPGTTNGMYRVKPLSGSIRWVAVNSDILDNREPHITWLGNINENSTLKVLYGVNE